MDYKNPEIKWLGKPNSSLDELIRNELRTETNLQRFHQIGWSDLIFHTIFVNDLHGPTVSIFGCVGEPNAIEAIYDEKAEWVTISGDDL